MFAAWAAAPDTDSAAVADLLFELPWQVVLEQLTWVRSLLDTTEGERRENIVGGLEAAAFSGVFGSARVARIAEDAEKITAHEPPGTPTAELYAALDRSALHHQERERRDDEELDSGWRA